MNLKILTNELNSNSGKGLPRGICQEEDGLSGLKDTEKELEHPKDMTKPKRRNLRYHDTKNKRILGQVGTNFCVSHISVVINTMAEATYLRKNA